MAITYEQYSEAIFYISTNEPEPEQLEKLETIFTKWKRSFNEFYYNVGLFYLIGGDSISAGIRDIHPNFVKFILDHSTQVVDDRMYRHPLLHEISHQAGWEPGYLRARNDRENEIFKILWSHPIYKFLKSSPYYTRNGMDAFTSLGEEIRERRPHQWRGEMAKWVQDNLNMKTEWYPWDNIPKPSTFTLHRRRVPFEHYDLSDPVIVWSKMYGAYSSIVTSKYRKCDPDPLITELEFLEIVKSYCGCKSESFTECMHPKLTRSQWDSIKRKAELLSYERSEHCRLANERRRKQKELRLSKKCARDDIKRSKSLSSTSYMSPAVARVLRYRCCSSGNCAGFCCSDKIPQSTLLTEPSDDGTVSKQIADKVLKQLETLECDDDEALDGIEQDLNTMVTRDSQIFTMPTKKMSCKTCIKKFPLIGYALDHKSTPICSLCSTISHSEWGIRHNLNEGVFCPSCRVDQGYMRHNIEEKQKEFSVDGSTDWETFIDATSKEDLYKMFCM